MVPSHCQNVCHTYSLIFAFDGAHPKQSEMLFSAYNPSENGLESYERQTSKVEEIVARWSAEFNGSAVTDEASTVA